MANNIQNVSFSNDYTVQAEDIKRRQALAQLLQAQSMQPTGGTEMAGGIAIRRSPLEGLAKLAQGASGAYLDQQTQQKQKDLATKYQNDLTSTLANAMQAYRGTPGKPEIAMPSDDVGGGPGRGAVAPVAGDPMAAAMLMMKHPQTASMAGPMMTEAMNSEKLAKALAAAGYGPQGRAPSEGAPPVPNSGGAAALPNGGAPPTTAQSPNGIPPGVDPLAWALAVSKGDTGALSALVQKAYAERNKPIALREGDLVVQNPDGSFKSMYQQPKLPTGYLPQRDKSGQVTGATQINMGEGGATVPQIAQDTSDANKVVEVKLPDGTTTQGTLASLRQRYPQAFGGAAPAPQQPYRGTAPTDAAAIAQGAAMGNRPFSISVPPNGVPAADGGSFDGRSVVPGIGSQSPQDIANRKLSTEAAAGADKDFQEKVFRPAMDTAQTAARNNAEIRALATNPIASQTGWGTPQKAWAANVVAGIAPGMTSDRIKNYASNAQTFQAFVMERNRVLLNEAKGVQTEGDAKRINETFAQLKNTPAANAFLLDYAQAVNNNAIRKAEFFRGNQEKAIQGGNLRTLENEWGKVAPSIWDDPALRKWNQQTPAARAGELNLSPTTRKYLEEVQGR